VKRIAMTDFDWADPGAAAVSGAQAMHVELLRTLVAFDTTSRNSNLALVRWAVARLTDAGARISLTHDATGTKANVLACFGPDVPGGIVLSAHTDTVPVDGQIWSSDPFTLTERDGRFYGRGAADMKGFVACCLAAAPKWSAARLRLPIVLALSYDEEVGCFGVPGLVADLVANFARPALVVVGEPTGMRIGDGHRGYLGFRTAFHGHAAHSSDPGKGENAIAAAARFVGAFLLGGDPVAAGGVERTTRNVGQISGGTNINVVPSRCEVLWEIRPGASADVAALRASADALIQSATPENFRSETEEIINIPPLRPLPANPAIAIAERLGALLPLADLPFGTEGGFFQAAGIPTIVCGPGSIDQAHQADEWICADQLGQAMRFLDRVRLWAEAE
jgi:acetylornithine deacetylase